MGYNHLMKAQKVEHFVEMRIPVEIVAVFLNEKGDEGWHLVAVTPALPLPNWVETEEEGKPSTFKVVKSTLPPRDLVNIFMKRMVPGT